MERLEHTETAARIAARQDQQRAEKAAAQEAATRAEATGGALGDRRSPEREDTRPPRTKRKMPMGFLVARYFLYVLAAVGCWIVALLALCGLLLLGWKFVYPASYGDGNYESMLETLSEQDEFNGGAIPSAYRYIHLSADGQHVLHTDLPGDPANWDIDPQFSLKNVQVNEGKTFRIHNAVSYWRWYYSGTQLKDGSWCLICWELLPQFASRDLRDALPNPLNLLIAVFALGCAGIIAALAARASHVITKKMTPLIEAARRIEQQDLDFALGASNVRQIDDAMGAMEHMRESLKRQLEARWRAEEGARVQMAALAHDLKTPLTVVRANAEFAAEEARGLMAGGAGSNRAGAAREETASETLAGIVAAAEDAARGSMQLDAHVRLLIEVARGEAAVGAKSPANAQAVADAIARETEPLARAAGAKLAVAQDEAALAAAVLEADAAALERAALNVVANALDHTPAGGEVRISFAIEENTGDANRTDADEGACNADGESAAASPSPEHDAPSDAPADRFFTIAVDDDGPGFTPEALAHGCERFFRGEASRTGAASGVHYGIGLSSAADILHAHHGTIELANRTVGIVEDAEGAASDSSPSGERAQEAAGAHVTLRIPLAR